MIYTTQPGESFDAEILQQELVAAIGPNGWYLNTSGNQVDFTYRQEWLSELAFAGPAPTIQQLYQDAEEVILAHFANSVTRDHNKAIDTTISTMEAKNPITHRTQREFMLGVQKLIGQMVGITEAQMLDPQSPNYSHAYAAFKAFNDATIVKRAGRINK